jgi:hypothetical protein
MLGKEGEQESIPVVSPHCLTVKRYAGCAILRPDNSQCRYLAKSPAIVLEKGRGTSDDHLPRGAMGERQ